MSEQVCTYTAYITDKSVRVLGADCALLAARLGAFADEQGIARVSNEYLCNTFGWSANSLRKYARKLQMLGIWTRMSGTSRTHISEWKKGANFEPYMDRERVQKMREKGANFEPYIKRIINKNACAPAREKSAAQRKDPKKGLPIFFAGDPNLQPEMIDSMILLKYNGKLAYAYERDLQECLAAGATKFYTK